MKRTAKEKPFAKEADLCAAFIERVKKEAPRWTCYPETEAWDILMSCSETGVQVGVQAKLRLNPEVVSQSLSKWGEWYACGPDHRAVLVPIGEVQKHMTVICERLGIKVLMQRSAGYGDDRYHRYLDLPSKGDWGRDGWHQWCPEQRHRLPDYIPDVVAGSSAPVTLSHWKISAIKLAQILERRPVTRADIKKLNMSPTRWCDRISGYLVATEKGYVPSKYMPDFKRMHPTNWDQIAADIQTWGADFRISDILLEAAE